MFYELRYITKSYNDQEQNEQNEQQTQRMNIGINIYKMKGDRDKKTGTGTATLITIGDILFTINKKKRKIGINYQLKQERKFELA